MEPVTNYDFTARAAIERLRILLAEPPLTITLSGSSLQSPAVMRYESVVMAKRDEIENVIRLLQKIDEPDTPCVVKEPAP